MGHPNDRAFQNTWLVVQYQLDFLGVKPAGKQSRNAYENDYAALSQLQQWATQNGIAVLVLHHTRKGGADDPLEALSGSNGLSACADTTLVLDRDGNGITLYVRGRDVEEKETALRFDGGYWSILGEANEVHRSAERRKILEVLRDADEIMTAQEIAVAVSMKRNNVDQLLYKMAKGGEVSKCGRGKYRHPSRTDLEVDLKTPDKKDKKIREGTETTANAHDTSEDTNHSADHTSYRTDIAPIRNSAGAQEISEAQMPDNPEFSQRNG